MSIPDFERSSLLDELGVDHGFGTRASGNARIRALSTCRQVHGDRVIRAVADVVESADGIYTDQPDRAVGIVTADCVPLLIADRDSRLVAAVHAGWRGSAAQIARRAIETLREACAIPAEALVVALGPHIGACCYEVDAPVRAAIADAAAFAPAVRAGHFQLDLYALNRGQLLSAGVPAAQIEKVGGCTMCDPASYPSFRRDGASGRMLHYVRQPSA